MGTHVSVEKQKKYFPDTPSYIGLWNFFEAMCIYRNGKNT